MANMNLRSHVVMDTQTKRLKKRYDKLLEELKNTEEKYKEAQSKAERKVYDQIGDLVVEHYKIQTEDEIKEWFEQVKASVPVKIKETVSEEDMDLDNKESEKKETEDISGMTNNNYSSHNN